MININLTYATQSTNLKYDDKKNTQINLYLDMTNHPTVDDHIRCYIVFSNNGFNFTTKNNINQDPKFHKKIALITESPHKDEFDWAYNPLIPINGKSKIRFAKEILNHIQKWNLYPQNGYTYEIKIFNPVQYQTSLYHFLNNQIPYAPIQQIYWVGMNAKLRNDVWKFLFIDCNLYQHFIANLSHYAPDYIINCCTYTSESAISYTPPKNFFKTLKVNVKRTIKNDPQLQKITCIEDRHPSSW